MSAALQIAPAPAAFPADPVAAVRAVVARDLVPLVGAIDRDGLYPEGVLRSLGEAGAFGSHLPGYGADGPIDLARTVGAIAVAGEECLSTAFCTWCQSALGWYVWCSDNAGLKARIGADLASGRRLGGTGLSNPMKTFFGIETMRLKGLRVDGGWRVRGTLPWISNLGPDHLFAAVFLRDDGRPVMALMSCAGEGVTLAEAGSFLALDGTRTYGVQIRDAFVPDGDVLADPAEPYVKRIRGGFVLMQVGMGIGLARGCARSMRAVDGPLGHVNRFLDTQPDGIEAEADALEARVAELAGGALDADAGTWRAIVETRLAASELALSAAQAAMLHSGARGYVEGAEPQRRLREAYFVAIVTPAVKQLKKMLAEMPT